MKCFVNFDQHLSRDNNVANPPPTPLRIVVKSSDLVDLLLCSELGNLKGRDRTPSQPPHLRFLVW